MKNYLDKFTESYKDKFPYSLDNRLILNWYPERVLNLAKGNSLLELGLGHGYSSLKFSEKFKRHVVIEGSEEIITLFNINFGTKKISIIHSYFEEYTAEEKFDVIVMGFILEHVADPSLILQKYKQFLNPGGSIFIAVPNAETLNKRFGYEAGLIKNLEELSQADLALGHRRLFTVDSLKSLVSSKGLSIKAIEGIFLKPITTQQIINLDLSEEILQAMLKVGINYPELCVGILMETKELR